MWTGITGRQGSWKTKLGGGDGGGGGGWGQWLYCLVPVDSLGPDLTRPDSGWVGGSSVLKKGVRVKGKLNTAKPLAIIAWLVLVVIGGEREFSVLGFGSLETERSIKSGQDCKYRWFIDIQSFSLQQISFFNNFEN